MKKLIFLLALTFGICVSSPAQTPVIKENVEYCGLRADTKAFKAKSKVLVDYGNGEERLVDGRGKELLFGSSVGVLNYMHTKGWEVMDIYQENGYTYYFLRRRR